MIFSKSAYCIKNIENNDYSIRNFFNCLLIKKSVNLPFLKLLLIFLCLLKLL